MLWQRLLDKYAVYFRISIQLAHSLVENFLRNIRGKLDVAMAEAKLLAHCALAFHVHMASGIVPDKHRDQCRSMFRFRSDILYGAGQAIVNAYRYGLAFEKDHVPKSSSLNGGLPQALIFWHCRELPSIFVRLELEVYALLEEHGGEKPL